jgi:hypothetical protein
MSIYIFSSPTREAVVHDQKLIFDLQGQIEKQQAVPVLDKINARNSQINNFQCDLRTTIQVPGARPIKLNGSLSYEKDTKLRIQLYSILGLELDIGADGKQFWFWSYRLKNSTLFWGDIANFSKTRLKPALHPKWIAQCMGVETINYQNAIIDKNNDNRWLVINKDDTVTTVTYIDAKQELITGHGIYQNNILQASSEIHEFVNKMPTKMTFIWHEDNTSIIWSYNNTVVNDKINAKKWVMPMITPKIELTSN